MKHIVCLAVFAVFAQGCGGALISNKQERALGKGVHGELRKEHRLVHSNDPVAKWAKAFVKPLEKGSKRFRNPKEVHGYKVAVIADDKLINAFAAPGGYTYLSTGLILSAKDCAEIAGVMGHELAHVTQRHGAKAIERTVAAQTLIGMFLGDGLSAGAAALAFGVLQGTTFSQEQETESDSVGLRITKTAGYNPYGLADFFRKLLKKEKGIQAPQFLSSHPATKSRIRSVEKEIKRRYGKKLKRSHKRKCRTKMKLAAVKRHIRSGKMKTIAKLKASPKKAKKKKK